GTRRCVSSVTTRRRANYPSLGAALHVSAAEPVHPTLSYTPCVLSRSSGEGTLPCPGHKGEREEEKRRRMTARRLPTRGPNALEPPEAQPQTVPVGKRTALKVQEKVPPRRAGIRATCRSCSAA